MNTLPANKCRWDFHRHERAGIAVAICLFLLLGFLLERRTALRHVPMTDLGVYCIASTALWSGQNPYEIPDWHGWHYQYPPALAILFLPLAEPLPAPRSALLPYELRTMANTPWGYFTPGNGYYGLHPENLRFFFTVAAWYVLSLLGILLSAHLLACALEGSKLRSPPPEDAPARRRWWWRRLLPLAVCAGSLVTDLSRGQVDILMLTTVACGLYFAAGRANFKAGLCLAFPAAVKLFPPLLLAYPFLRRQWRMAAGVLAGLFMLLAVLPVAALGPGRTIELYQCWIEVLAKPALGQGADISRQRELTGMGSTDNQSLLAVIHNWTYHSLPPTRRPLIADPWERYAVYAAGALMIVATLAVIGFRRTDSPHELLAVAGLLVGIGLIVNPVVHNFYYLLMLPLVATLVDSGLLRRDQGPVDWNLVLPPAFFMLADLAARLPGIGLLLRDYGVITFSLLWLLWAGGVFLASQARIRRVSATG